MGDENENQQKNIISQFHDRNLRNVFLTKIISKQERTI